ncbi:hypothetical protein HDV00_009098 [Rhizophlyctis rosea]|nr:hypothetical protein HDV00_009098 [Rhizophlyctis rosea]
MGAFSWATIIVSVMLMGITLMESAVNAQTGSLGPVEWNVTQLDNNPACQSSLFTPTSSLSNPILQSCSVFETLLIFTPSNPVPSTINPSTYPQTLCPPSQCGQNVFNAISDLTKNGCKTPSTFPFLYRTGNLPAAGDGYIKPGPNVWMVGSQGVYVNLFFVNLMFNYAFQVGCQTAPDGTSCASKVLTFFPSTPASSWPQDFICACLATPTAQRWLFPTAGGIAGFPTDMLNRINQVTPSCPPVNVSSGGSAAGGGNVQNAAPTQPGWSLNPVPTNAGKKTSSGSGRTLVVGVGWVVGVGVVVGGWMVMSLVWGWELIAGIKDLQFNGVRQ